MSLSCIPNWYVFWYGMLWISYGIGYDRYHTGQKFGWYMLMTIICAQIRYAYGETPYVNFYFFLPVRIWGLTLCIWGPDLCPVGNLSLIVMLLSGLVVLSGRNSAEFRRISDSGPIFDPFFPIPIPIPLPNGKIVPATARYVCVFLFC